MKRLVISSTYDVSDIKSIVPDYASPFYTYGDGAQDVIDTDPSFFSDFVCGILVYNLHKKDRRYTAKIKIYLPIGRAADARYREAVKGLEVSRKCPVSDKDLKEMVSKLKQDTYNYFESRLQAKLERKELSEKNLRKLSAHAYTNKVIKDELGVSPTFQYSDSHKSLYMLWDLPFTDPHTLTLDTKAGEEFRDKFISILNKLESELGFYFIVDTPLGGSHVRACFSFKVYGPDVLYNKVTREVTLA